MTLDSPRLLAATTLLATLACTSSAATQIVTFGGDGERRSSSVFFWDKAANKLAGSVEFTYGAPVWQDKYEDVVKSDKSGSMRLGKDGWAALDTSIPRTFGGVKVAAGQWYLGLRRDEGKFFLMVMNADAVRKNRIPPWATAKVRAKINIPLTHEKVEKSAEYLAITAAPGEKAPDGDPTIGSFTLHWGKHQLKAGLVAHVGTVEAKDAGGKKGGAGGKKGAGGKQDAGGTKKDGGGGE